MTLMEIKNLIMFQTNNDADDLGDFLPHITDYINEGYDLLVDAWCGQHVSQDNDEYVPLRHDKAQPATPDWTHKAIADWATWLIYRNGNTNKQNRGYPFRESALSLFNKIRGMSFDQKGLDRTQAPKRYFYNIPR
jgi:hypothetical protein